MQAELRPRRPNRRMQRMRPIGAAEVPQVVGRLVRRVVVDEHSFPVDPHEHPIEPVDQRTDIVALVERRNDNGELRRCLRRHSRGRGR